MEASQSIDWSTILAGLLGTALGFVLNLIATKAHDRTKLVFQITGGAVISDPHVNTALGKWDPSGMQLSIFNAGSTPQFIDCFSLWCGKTPIIGVGWLPEGEEILQPWANANYDIPCAEWIALRRTVTETQESDLILDVCVQLRNRKKPWKTTMVAPSPPGRSAFVDNKKEEE